MPAGAFSETLFLKILEGKSVTAPANLYLALCEEEQTRNLKGTTLKAECNYSGYERAKLTLSSAGAEVKEGTSSEISKFLNKEAIEVHKNEGANEHNKAKNFAIVDGGPAKGTEGNLWWYGPLTEAVEIAKALTKIEFPAKALEITCE